MIRDENLRQIRKEAGKLGGNPVLLKQKPTSRLKQKSTPSSSSSFSSSDIPPNPQGGLELEIEETKKPDFDQIAVGKLLGRREATKWSPEEIKLLKAIKPIHPEDMALMAKFYGAEIPAEKDYRRTSIPRLLKHWSGELDKARIFASSQQ
jgi:hypothetical protein